jgi:hypothetical protein
MPIKLKMRLLEGFYGVCRLGVVEPIPQWAYQGDFFSITKTQDELSVVCLQNNIPSDIKFEGEWKILKVEGPLDFSLVGILAAISSTLAEVCISIFAVSTYDTDYILVKDKNIETAITALENEGYLINR